MTSDKIRLSVEEAVTILETLGSAEDPVYISGMMVSPRELEGMGIEPSARAADVRLAYHGIPTRLRGRRRRLHKITGTLLSMVRERMASAV